MDSNRGGEKLEDAYARILAMTEVDAELRERLIADPRNTLRDHGIEVQDDVAIKVIESSDLELLLPLPPFRGDKLSEDQLNAMAGGSRDLRVIASWFLYPGAIIKDKIEGKPAKDTSTYALARWVEGG